MAQNLGAVSCSRCGDEYEIDPVYLVTCPSCQAPPRAPCKRPSEHPAWAFHMDRDRAALAAGIYGKCAGGEPDHGPRQLALELG